MLVVQEDQTLIEEYQRGRIMAWLYPDEYSTSTAYQQLNSIMAIGSGMLFGKGYKNNEITSVKNGNFISEPQTDFIFAIFAEEFGFIGCCVVLLLFATLIINGYKIASNCSSIEKSFLAVGITSLIAVQVIINLCVVIGLFPVTGITLPLFSYGGSSLVLILFMCGLLISVDRKDIKNENNCH
jgi:rod shape determining protein RodA